MPLNLRRSEAIGEPLIFDAPIQPKPVLYLSTFVLVGASIGYILGFLSQFRLRDLFDFSSRSGKSTSWRQKA